MYKSLDPQPEHRDQRVDRVLIDRGVQAQALAPQIDTQVHHANYVVIIFTHQMVPV